MKIAITGGTGLIGREIISLLLGKGHQLRVLSRSKEISIKGCDIHQGDICQLESLENFLLDIDCLIQLCRREME